MLTGLVVFWKGITANVLGDKGMQPKEYVNKKVAGMSVAKIFVYALGFIAVPVFAYLMSADTQSEVLGNVLSMVGGLVLLYVFYMVYMIIKLIKDSQSGDRLIAMILAVFAPSSGRALNKAGSSITVWVDKCVNLVGMNALQTNTKLILDI